MVEKMGLCLYISYGVEHLIGLAPKLSKMSRTYSHLFGTSFYDENKLHYFIYQKCSDLNCTILESNLGNVLLTNFDSFSHNLKPSDHASRYSFHYSLQSEYNTEGI